MSGLTPEEYLRIERAAKVAEVYAKVAFGEQAVS